MKAVTPLSSLATVQTSPLPAYEPGCGCATTKSLDDGRPLDVDPAIKDRNLKRLRRVEGQVRGLQRMVDEDRSCVEIMTQISSAHEALRAVGRELMRNHLKHCTMAAVGTSNGHAEPMYDELIEMMYKLSR
jgi:DNA-binding FrmR family transcriptional regulator